MKKVIIEGTLYLGKLVTNLDKTFTLKQAYQPSSTVINKDVFASYLKAKNIGTLEIVNFGGSGGKYSISPLTKNQKLDLSICKLTMDRAKALAAPKAENTLFSELLGK